MAALSLRKLARRLGRARRKVVILRPIKPTLAERRELEAIGAEIVREVHGFVPELVKAMEVPDANPYRGVPGFTDSADDIDRIMNLIVTRTNQVMTRLELRIRQWGADLERRHRRDFGRAAGAAIGAGAQKRRKPGQPKPLIATNVTMETVLNPEDVSQTVRAVVTRATNLIRDLGDEARKRVGDIVLNGVTTRMPPREVAKQLRDSEDMSMRRALNIAADQANKLNAALDRARQEQAGIRKFRWRHSGKVHARPEHLERDGEIYEWDTDDIEPGDFPGEPPFCGCVAEAVLELDDGTEVDDIDEDDEGE